MTPKEVVALAVLEIEAIVVAVVFLLHLFSALMHATDPLCLKVPA